MEQHKPPIKCKESFQAGIAYASFLVVKMCVNCIEHDESHAKTLQTIANRIINDATRAFAEGKLHFVEDAKG